MGALDKTFISEIWLFLSITATFGRDTIISALLIISTHHIGYVRPSLSQKFWAHHPKRDTHGHYLSSWLTHVWFYPLSWYNFQFGHRTPLNFSGNLKINIPMLKKKKWGTNSLKFLNLIYYMSSNCKKLRQRLNWILGFYLSEDLEESMCLG